MQHPFFKNIKIFGFYCLLWVLIGCTHFYILFNYQHAPIEIAILDSVVSNILFLIIGIFVWYLILYTKSEKTQVINVFINHITFISIILVIWLALSGGILHLILDDSTLIENNYSNALPWKIVSGILFYTILVLIYYIIIYYHNIQEKIMSESAMLQMVKDAELNMLKSQINPHFLFNSLNSISSLTITNPEKAQEMIIILSDFLRYTVSKQEQNLVTLALELENIERYLKIEKARFGDKLIFINQINEECLNVHLPAMILQPLFENAIKHGVYESLEPITIKVNCVKIDNFILITIINNFDLQAKPKKGAGIGIKNIKERLKLMYNNDKLLKTETKNNIFQVELYIPIGSQIN